MNLRQLRASAIVCLTFAIYFYPTLSRAEFPTSRPYAAVHYEHIVSKTPAINEYVVTVDLTDPRVHVGVFAGGADPDGPGPWETTLLSVKKIAEREKLQVAVNASYFRIPSNKPIPEEEAENKGKPGAIAVLASGYAEGRWANDEGLTIANGRRWKLIGPATRPTVWVSGDKKVAMGIAKDVPVNATAAVSGNVFVLKDGAVVDEAGNAKQRHPRTVVGLDQPGKKLVIMTVDGRQESSIGMNGTEMGLEMKRLGCYSAINLDGGGSTTLVMHDPEKDDYKVMNVPSDGHERSVADAFGIRVND